MCENKKTVAVVFGGASSEYEISLLSAASILRHLSRETYDILGTAVWVSPGKGTGTCTAAASMTLPAAPG